jgi:hypothetical protein
MVAIGKDADTDPGVLQGDLSALIRIHVNNIVWHTWEPTRTSQEFARCGNSDEYELKEKLRGCFPR